jgi:hypothetical protein
LTTIQCCGIEKPISGGFKTPLRLDQLLTDRAVSISAAALLVFLCLLPGGPFPPLLSNSLRVARSLPLAIKPIAQPNLFKVAFLVPLPAKPVTLYAPIAMIHVALTDVPVDARDTCEVPFQPKLDRCFSTDFLHRESAVPDSRVIRPRIPAAVHKKTPADQAFSTPGVLGIGIGHRRRPT